MNGIFDLKVGQLPGFSFECSCGRKHSVDIGDIIIGRDVLKEISRIASPYKGKKLFILVDNNTYEVYGRQVEGLLQQEGHDIRLFMFKAPHYLIPDEKAVGRLLMELEKDVALVITVGSGTLNDISRFVSYKMGIPYIIVGTAPSMDGYASIVSPLVIEGAKKTHKATYARSIIADTAVLKNAPMVMLQAGFGDIAGKYTALADWALAREVNKDYYCETTAKLVRNALEKCVNNIDGLVNRDEDAVRYVLEGLILSGVAIGLVGVSRPASGTEHQMAHHWEMGMLARTGRNPLHGICVGVGTVVACTIYEMLGDRCPAKVDVPKPEEIEAMLRKLGSPASPVELGVDRELFIEGIRHSQGMKSYRYTVMSYLDDTGLLEEFIEKLAAKFYGR